MSHRGEQVDVDFTGFRDHLRPGEWNLAQSHLAHCGLPLDLADNAWIDRRKFFVDDHPFDLVVHRTERYRNPLFPWKLVVEKFGKRAAFVGLAREYLDFVSQHGSVFLRPTRDLLELASVIAGSRLFAGNQSVGYALAEAMKVDSLLEAYPGFLDCGFSRPNLRQVADGNVPLAWIAGILDSAPHPAEDLQ